MAFSTLPDALIQVGRAVKREIFANLKNNDDDMDSRLSALEAGANKIVVFDRIVQRPSAVGDLMWSYLEPAEFVTRYGSDWVLADGTSIAGSDLATLRTWGAIPDSRGRFIRMRDSSGAVDLGGVRALGHNQGDDNKAHTHSLYEASGATNPQDAIAIAFENSVALTTSSSGTESRPKNTCANLYARINDGSFEGVDLWRAPAGFQLLSAIVTTLTAGTAGTLEVDVQKGSSLASMSTVFSTLPSVGFASGNYASSSNAAFASTDISTNDWLRLDISSLQTNQTNFHMYLIGEVS